LESTKGDKKKKRGGLRARARGTTARKQGSWTERGTARDGTIGVTSSEVGTVRKGNLSPSKIDREGPRTERTGGISTQAKNRRWGLKARDDTHGSDPSKILRGIGR